METDPFPELCIKPASFLDDLQGRSKCSKCSKSRKYYCYTCYIPVPEIVGRVPKIRLPLKVDIIKHPSEVDGKSTALHAGVIAPEDVTIYTYPCIPDYKDKSKVVLVFPGPTAVTLEDLAKKWKLCTKHNIQDAPGLKRKLDICDNAFDCAKDGGSSPKSLKASKLEEGEGVKMDDNGSDRANGEKCDINSEDNGENQSKDGKPTLQKRSEERSDTETNINKEEDGDIRSGKEANVMSLEAASDVMYRLVPGCTLERVVFVDSTWNQTKTICSDERLKGLTHVELQTRTTKFWRHQRDIPDTYLSTIEAIYYFLRDFHQHFVQQHYTGDYDNLLFFFKYMYSKIRNLYDGGDNLKAYKDRRQK